MFYVVFQFLKGLHVSFSKNNVYKSIIATVLIMIGATSCFYYFEVQNIEGLSYWDSLWWSFVTVTTVGYGDYFPESLVGRIMAGVLMIAGIGTFGFVTAAVASSFVELNLKRGMGVLKLDFEDHVIIIGWNKKAVNIIEELVREMPNRNIVIIDDIERLETDYKKVFFVRGKGSEDNVLENAAIKKASLAIILANEKDKDEEGSDASGVLVSLAIKHLNPKIRLVAEVSNEEHLPHFRRANADEVFLSSKIGSNLLIRGALYPKVSQAINELLTNSRGSEFYQVQLDDSYIGMSFKEVIQEFIDKDKGIPIGVADKVDTHVNPGNEYKMKKDDILIYIGTDKIRI